MIRQFAVALCLLLPACTGTKGSGATKIEAREVGKFSAIEAGGALTLDVTVGRSRSVQVSGDDNIVPLITTEVQGERLVIKSTKSYSSKTPVKVTISVPVITMVSISGAGRLDMRGVKGDSLQVKLSGAAKAQMEGKIGKLELTGSGACKVGALQLHAGLAMVDISGAGEAELSVVEKLMVKISGAGKVRYRGKPQVTEEIDGAGSVKEM
mgnify:CR=1 FL=1